MGDRADARDGGKANVVSAFDRLGTGAVLVTAPIGLTGDDATAGHGDDLVPAVVLDEGRGWRSLAIPGKLMDVRIVTERVGFHEARRRLSGPLVGHAATNHDAALKRDIELDRPQAGRIGGCSQTCSWIGLAFTRLDGEPIHRPPGQPGEAITTLGVSDGLDPGSPESTALLEDHAVELDADERTAGVFVADGSLDRPRRGRGAIEPACVVDGPFRSIRSLRSRLDDGDSRSIVVEDVEVGCGDRRRGYEHFGDSVAACSLEAEAAV